MQFRCIDSALHAQISVQIEDAEGMQSAFVIASVELAAIDNFLPKLRQIQEELSGEAMLDFSR